MIWVCMIYFTYSIDSYTCICIYLAGMKVVVQLAVLKTSFYIDDYDNGGGEFKRFPNSAV